MHEKLTSAVDVSGPTWPGAPRCGFIHEQYDLKQPLNPSLWARPRTDTKVCAIAYVCMCLCVPSA